MTRIRAGKWQVGASICIALFISVAYAQQPNADTPSFKAQADVVLIPVIVRDGSGAPVSGLPKAGFTVFENGKPQTISVFEEVRTTAGAQPAQVPEGSFTNTYSGDSAPQRVTIIALDTVNTPFPDQAYARHQILKFLSRNLDAQQPIALVAITAKGVRMLHDFTTDSASLITALKGVAGVPPSGPSPTGRVDRGVDLNLIKSALTASNINADANSPRVKLVADEIERVLAFENGVDDEFAAQRRASMETSLESLQHLAQLFAGIPGKKSLIWVTGGFPFEIDRNGNLTSPTIFNQGTTTITESDVRSGVLGHMPESTQVLHDDSIKMLEPLYVQTLHMLASSNVAVYPVDALGIVAEFPGAEAQNVNLSIPREARERHQSVLRTLNTFATMTGGNSCFGTNDLSGCFNKATRDTETYYMVGYYRDQKNNKTGWRPLEVKVDKPGSQVHARSGYFYSKDNPAAPTSRQMDVKLALASPVAYTAIPLTVKLQKSQEAAQKGKLSYKFVMRVPPAGIVLDEKNNLNMEFVVTADGSKGNREDQVAQHVAMQLKPESVPQLRADGLTYDNKLLLSPGKYLVHFVVRDNQTGRTGSVVTPVTVN